MDPGSVRQAGEVTTPDGFQPQFGPATTTTTTDGRPSGSPIFDTTIPLGGVGPGNEAPPESRPIRHLVLAVVLLIAAILAAWASTMPWRDQVWHRPDTDLVTGWTRANGVLGRGWLTMLLALLIAGSGLLIAISKQRPGRILAVASGVGLMVLATVEWGVAGTPGLDGPGKGLWLQLIVGVVVVLAVGVVTPLKESAS